MSKEDKSEIAIRHCNSSLTMADADMCDIRQTEHVKEPRDDVYTCGSLDRSFDNMTAFNVTEISSDADELPVMPNRRHKDSPDLVASGKGYYDGCKVMERDPEGEIHLSGSKSDGSFKVHNAGYHGVYGEMLLHLNREENTLEVVGQNGGE